MSVIVTGVDIETTGLNVNDGHRIIEIALDIHRFDGKKLTRVKTFNQRIDPQRGIDKGAQDIHGISYDMLKGSPTWDVVAPNIGRIIAATKILVAHNADFDAPFIGAELNRVKQPIPKCSVFCTMENGRFATPLGKLPSLVELCWACGVDFDETSAHAADYDIIKTMECLQRGIDLGYYKLPIGD